MYHRCHICASLKINQVSATSNTTIMHFSLVFLPHKLDPTRPRGLGHVSEPGGLISRSNHHCSHLIKGHVLDVMYVCVFSHMNGEIDPLHTRLYLTFYTFFFYPTDVGLFLQNFSPAQCRLVSFYSILTPTQFKETLSWDFNRHVIPCGFSFIQLRFAAWQKCAMARSFLHRSRAALGHRDLVSWRCSYNPQLVGFPKHDILHVCTCIKDRAATISDFFDLK